MVLWGQSSFYGPKYRLIKKNVSYYTQAVRSSSHYLSTYMVSMLTAVLAYKANFPPDDGRGHHRNMSQYNSIL